MTVYQGALMLLQHMEGDSNYDPIQALYARRVRQFQLTPLIKIKIRNKQTKCLHILGTPSNFQYIF